MQAKSQSFVRYVFSEFTITQSYVFYTTDKIKIVFDRTNIIDATRIFRLRARRFGFESSFTPFNSEQTAFGLAIRRPTTERYGQTVTNI